MRIVTRCMPISFGEMLDITMYYILQLTGHRLASILLMNSSGFLLFSSQSWLCWQTLSQKEKGCHSTLLSSKSVEWSPLIFQTNVITEPSAIQIEEPSSLITDVITQFEVPFWTRISAMTVKRQWWVNDLEVFWLQKFRWRVAGDCPKRGDRRGKMKR